MSAAPSDEGIAVDGLDEDTFATGTPIHLGNLLELGQQLADESMSA